MAGRAAVVFEGAAVETVRAGAGDDGDLGAGLAEFGIGDDVGDGEFADDVDGDGDGGAPLVDVVVGYAVEEVVVRKGAGLPLTVTPPKSRRFVFDDTVGEEDELIEVSEGEVEGELYHVSRRDICMRRLGAAALVWPKSGLDRLRKSSPAAVRKGTLKMLNRSVRNSRPRRS